MGAPGAARTVRGRYRVYQPSRVYSRGLRCAHRAASHHDAVAPQGRRAAGPSPPRLWMGAEGGGRGIEVPFPVRLPGAAVDSEGGAWPIRCAPQPRERREGGGAGRALGGAGAIEGVGVEVEGGDRGIAWPLPHRVGTAP